VSDSLYHREASKIIWTLKKKWQYQITLAIVNYVNMFMIEHLRKV